MGKPRLISLKEIVKITSLSKATVYRYIEAGSFPKNNKIGNRRVAWKESDVLDWMANFDSQDGNDGDHFTKIARKLAEGTLKGEIILGGQRRLRMLRTDERVVIERKGPTE